MVMNWIRRADAPFDALRAGLSLRNVRDLHGAPDAAASGKPEPESPDEKAKAPERPSEQAQGDKRTSFQPPRPRS